MVYIAVCTQSTDDNSLIALICVTYFAADSTANDGDKWGSRGAVGSLG